MCNATNIKIELKTIIMHRDNNIFYRAVKKDENHTTDLFCNLLKYDFIRDYLLKFFKLPVENLEYENIDTQKKIEENKKEPDITIKNKDIYCFFEIKVKNSQLQSSQINEYLSELEKEEKKLLIYLIPENYNFKNEINKGIKNKDYAKIYYWEDFIRYIENSDLPQSNILISEFIAFLKSVLGKQDLSLTLNLEEMALFQNPKDLIIAKSLLDKLYKIIDESVKQVDAKLQNKISNTIKYDDENQYGVMFKDKENQNLLFFALWFGVYNRNNDCSDYLFCYGIGDETSDEPFIDKYVKRFKEFGVNECAGSKGWQIKNFDKYDLAIDKENELIENISKKLIYTIEKLLKPNSVRYE